MKKIIGSILVSVFVIGGTSLTYAANENVEVREFNHTELINGEKADVTGIELTSIEQPESTHEIILYAAGERNASTTVTNPWFGDLYVTAKSSATYNQNTIGAKVRAFKSDGRAIGTQAITNYNSKSATAKTYPKGWGVTNTAYGNHTFKRNGYKDWFPETVKQF